MEESDDRRAAIVGSWVLTVLLLAGTVGLVTSLSPPRSSAFEAPWWIVIPIGVGFALAERFLFNLELRREAISFSLSEVPTAFALAFLGPIPAIAVRVGASVLALGPGLRHPWFKVAFNGALFAFEAALAFVVARAIAPVGSDIGTFLVAVAAGSIAAAAAGLLRVCLVISVFEGDPLRQLRSAFVPTSLTSLTSGLIGSVAVAPALIGLEYSWLALLPILGAWMVLRRHGSLAQEFRDLTDLHRFGQLLDESLDLDDVAPQAIREIARLVNAERVTLEVTSVDGARRTWHVGALVCRDDATEDITTTATVTAAAAAATTTTTTTTTATSLERPGQSPATGAPTSFSLPVVADGEELGVLCVADCVGRSDRFERRDLDRARDLADQLAASLRNGVLHASIARTAMYDELTGEHNRASFEHRLGTELVRPIDSVLGVMVVDLNHFKEVNDTLGHHVGDQVLIEVARRIRSVLDFDDLVARLGGDEYAVLARRSSSDEVRSLAERILTTTYSPLSLDACDAVVPASVGIALATERDVDPSAVMRRADIAMYAAKSQRSGIEMYREEIDRRTPARLGLLGDLRAAIERDELEVHYQPKIDLRTSLVTGAEALVRWNHPDRGLVPPIDFIGVAEESGLIRLITDVVLSKSIRRARSWRDAGFDLDVSVNLSALDLHDDELAHRIQRHLDEHEIGAHRLVIEITESALMVDTQRTMETIDSLDLLGVRLSLDDFGTGYSSLSHLRSLPVAELKIDRSFVSDLLLNVNDDVIVRSTIDLGHNLGLGVVAEGIENAQVADHLRTLGCDIGQGFGISRPLEPELFMRWLETSIYQVNPVRSTPSTDDPPAGAADHVSSESI
ncbi:MAG: EAL domain-containing protein [Actinomycetota bacterium]